MLKSEMARFVGSEGPPKSHEWKLREINSTQFMDELIN